MTSMTFLIVNTASHRLYNKAFIPIIFTIVSSHTFACQYIHLIVINLYDKSFITFTSHKFA